MSSPLCLRHRTAPVAALCHRCGDGLCDACFTFAIGARPLCEQCAQDLVWRVQLVWPRLALFVVIASGLAFWASRHVPSDIAAGAWLVVVLGAIAGVFVTRGHASEARRNAEQVTRRAPGQSPPDPFARPDHPYRARFARVAARAVPTVSARTTALVVGLVLLTTGVLVPVSLKLPHWLELEIVVGSWWILSLAGLATLLHRGTRLRDDHAFRLPRALGGPTDEARPAGGRTSGGWSLDGLDAGCVDAEGCLGIIVGVVLAAIALAAAWLFVELLFPAVFFFLYWLVVRAIGRVTNDTRGCEGRLDRSIGYGAFWATVYTLPLAAVVWLAHAIMAGHARGP